MLGSFTKFESEPKLDADSQVVALERSLKALHEGEVLGIVAEKPAPHSKHRVRAVVHGDRVADRHAVGTRNDASGYRIGERESAGMPAISQPSGC